MLRKKQKNSCLGCPYHGTYYDFNTDCGDEWCECGLCKNKSLGCNLPMFCRHILAKLEKLKEYIRDKRAEKKMKKERLEEK